MRSSYTRAIVLLLASLALTASAASSSIEVQEEDRVLWLNQGASDKTVDFTARCTEANITRAGIWDGSTEYAVSFDGGGNETASSSAVEGEKWKGENGTDEVGEFGFNVSQARSNGVGEFEPGSYQVFVKCSSSQTSSEFHYGDFQIDRALLDIQSPEEGDEIYLGTRPEAKIRMYSEMGNLDLGRVENVRMSLEPEDESSTLLRETDFRSETMTLKSSSDLDLDLIQGDVSPGELDVEATYGQTFSGSDQIYSFEFSDTKNLEIKRYEIVPSVRPSKRLSYDDLGRVNISLKMMYNGKPLTPPRDDVSYAGMFYLERGDERDPGNYDWFSGGFQGVTDDGRYGSYSLKLEKIPELTVNQENQRHVLNVMFEDGEHGKIPVTDIQVRKAFSFEGRISDSSFRAIDADFTLDSGDFIERFSTDAQGEFSRRLLPGEYGFDIEFPRGRLTMEDVDLERNFSGAINYQYYESPGSMDLDLQGVTPVNMMAVSFGYPFQRADLEMEYNPAKTEDPTEVDVFECRNWNFFDESCVSGWQKIDSEDVRLPPTEWEAHFPADPFETGQYGGTRNVLLSAYVVGTESGLQVDRVALGSYRVAEGESFSVSGTVTSNSGAVEDADVEFALLRDGEFYGNATATTDGTGEFSTSSEGPPPGNYSVFISAEKQPYNPYARELDVELSSYREADISLSSGDTYELIPGETTSSSFELENTGQVELDSVSLEFARLGEIQGSLEESGIDSLGSGESREVGFNLTADEGYCSPSCARFPVIDLNVEADAGNGERLERTFELDVEVDPDSSSSSSSNQDDTADENDTSSSFAPLSGATGEFMQSQGAVNIALGLITVFTLALAGAIRSKKSSGQGSRDNRVSLQRPKVEPGEDEEVEQVAAEPGHEEDESQETEIPDEPPAVEEPEEGSGEDHEEDAEDDEWFDELEDTVDEEESGDTGQQGSGTEDEGQENESPGDSAVMEQEDEDGENVGEPGSGDEQTGQDVQDGEDEGEAGGFSCSECGEEFETRTGLDLHMDAIHDQGSGDEGETEQE